MIAAIETKMSRLASICLKAEGQQSGDDERQENVAEIKKHLFTLEGMFGDIKYDETYREIMLSIDYKVY